MDDFSNAISNSASQMPLTMPSIGSFEDVGRFAPKDDITPLEVLRFCELLSVVAMSKGGCGKWDFKGFVAKHGLQRHFEPVGK